MSNWHEQLEGDLAWREAELVSLKLHLVSAAEGSVLRKTLLRALWTMLYAHYEGFCRFAWDVYLDEIEAAGLRRQQLSDPLARFSLSAEFRQLRRDTSLTNLYHFCSSAFPDMMRQPAVFQDRLETLSNLSPDVVRNNCSLVGLPSAMVDEHEAALRALVARRNGIAHGQKMYVESFSEYTKYEKAAMLVMHEIAIAVVEILEASRYHVGRTRLSR